MSVRSSHNTRLRTRLDRLLQHQGPVRGGPRPTAVVIDGKWTHAKETRLAQALATSIDEAERERAFTGAPVLKQVTVDNMCFRISINHKTTGWDTALVGVGPRGDEHTVHVLRA